MTRLLPDSVRDHAAAMYERIASRALGGGYHWSLDEQVETAQRCISAAVSFAGAWQSRRQIHDDDVVPGHELSGLRAMGRRS